MILNERCDIWRMVVTGALGASSSKRATQRVRAGVPCLIVPITDVDTVIEFARESTHVAYLGSWMARQLHKDDELRLGRAIDPVRGGVGQDVYTVVGVRRFPVFGLQHVEAFVKHID